ncbi:aminotransferase class I/II-fold pyridoxal phosphate-dependent enzyme [Butyrivibrio sp. LC3010]|uniref:aminotransferase class I/II-fold pyridoxal phosphate-dependent enzyme n=1 Tax=Butyrivibrio sp. LC3010 TaxID=1280680 RepID=UPI00041E603D|nr:aminotransferase class I/II-fold pyridoxal phosphate-dependent enzyme [Butyrivibrio sp. LC3010]
MVNKNPKSIKSRLDSLNGNELYPFHMPGHKRNPDATDMAGYMDIDITEIDDFDNLHDADGIILEAEKRAAKLYGADETHFLVNGSTSGILAAVSAAVPDGGKLLASRNSHKALYHAAYIRRLELEYLKPGRIPLDNDRALWGKTDPVEVYEKLRDDSDISAVFITSPTYDGISSDIKKIAQICHEKNRILIVDAAHGAHFGLYEDFLESAITQGADLVINSVHKTLASMTQTALIHVQGNLVNRERLRRFLRIYQSSSPSYVLMASIDSAIEDIRERGNVVFKKLVSYKERILAKTADCKKLYVPGIDIINDPCKILISARDEAITGQQIYDILRLKYKLQPEMAGDHYALLIITGYDTEDGINRLIDAILDLDKCLSDIRNGDNLNIGEELKESEISCDTVSENEGICHESAPKGSEFFQDMQHKKTNSDIEIPELSEFPVAELTLHNAWDEVQKDILLSEAQGRISGDFINLYPPGIPLIAPGEVFSERLILNIEKYINEKMNIQGININDNGDIFVKVICRRDK